MKILHYSLGLPPFRSGGLTKYSMDLINQQAKLGADISLLYPGSIINNSTTKIVKNKKFNEVKVYEMINPLPIPLLDGVKNPKIFHEKRHKKYFYEWLTKKNFDILHIHTLMGLPYELLEVASSLNIKMVYTTHDYYGICPKVNLIRSNNEICNDNSKYSKCIECCENGFSYKKIMIMQSRPYRLIKGTSIGRKIIGITKKRYIGALKSRTIEINKNKSRYNGEQKKDYEKLQEYYKNIFEKIDLFHFNSNVSKQVFEKYLRDINGKIIPITHCDISDNRIVKKYDSDKLRILFLGNDLPYKGLQLLIDSLQVIDKSKWELNVYGTDIKQEDNNINYHGKYIQSELKNIFNKNDILIVPSIWYETFSLVALEAYSYGMPIIMTDLVGFKDMITNNENGFIIKPCKEELTDLIESLIKNKSILERVNSNILNKKFTLQEDIHIKKIFQIYEELIGE